jgi:hypothetical protein
MLLEVFDYHNNQMRELVDIDFAPGTMEQYETARSHTKTVEFAEDMLLEVTAVIKDLPPNSHLQFDALISWDSFNRYDAWGNLNAYTYILLRPDATIEEVHKKMRAVVATFHDLTARDYNATYEPVFEKITDIHFSRPLNVPVPSLREKIICFH